MAQAGETTPFFLHILAAGGQRAVAPLRGNDIVVGRAKDANVRLVGEGVSRQHSTFQRDAKGNWWIRDLGSRNGTLVNGFAIDQRMIDIGDRIDIGSYQITVLDTATPDAVPAAASAAHDATMPSRMAPSPPPAAAPARPVPRQAAVAANATAPKQLGGYEVLRELGRGGMGAVYLARQVSLNRRVAVKVMNPQWSANPVFLQRFTREAFAAAQLVHHNIVQIYDIGREANVSFFSMEYVEGRSLGEIFQSRGRVEPAECAGYILQAARGLKFAHDQGMIHRDIKPDNLMLNKQGVIKVADLGLVKSPGSDQAIRADANASSGGAVTSGGVEVTSVNEAMGTPAYMSPEQAIDATNVDGRADIYSLGCTFYKLVTGRPMFDARTADAMMDMHAEQEPVPPLRLCPDVGPDLNAIILKMVEKNPADRFQSMGELVKALEAFVASAEGATPDTPEQRGLPALRQVVAQYDEGAAGVMRSIMIGTFFLVCAAALVWLLFDERWALAASLAGGVAWTGACYFFLVSLDPRAEVAMRLRRYVFRRAWFWLFTPAILGAAGWAAYQYKAYEDAAKFLVAGLVLAIIMRLLIDRWVTAAQRTATERVEASMMNLRRSGMGEDQLRQNIAEHAGPKWEALYEQLFGYDAKITARRNWGLDANGRPRPRCGAWRDPFMAMIDRRYRQQHRIEERAVLEAVERDALVACGVSSVEARSVANRAAETMMENAEQFREKVEASAVSEAPVPLDMTQPPPRREPSDSPHHVSPQPDLVRDLLGDIPLEMTPAPGHSPGHIPAPGARPETRSDPAMAEKQAPSVKQKRPTEMTWGANVQAINEVSSDDSMDVTMLQPGQLLQDDQESTTRSTHRATIPFWAVCMIAGMFIAIVVVWIIVVMVVL